MTTNQVTTGPETVSYYRCSRCGALVTTNQVTTGPETVHGPLPVEAAKELLDVQDLCGYLKMSRATIQRWCRTGYLPAAKVGKEYRVRRADLEQWYERHFKAQHR